VRPVAAQLPLPSAQPEAKIAQEALEILDEFLFSADMLGAFR
jgi:hypothetical protein